MGGLIFRSQVGVLMVGDWEVMKSELARMHELVLIHPGPANKQIREQQRKQERCVYIWLTDFLIILWNIPVATIYVRGRQTLNTAFVLTDGLGCTLWTIGWRSLVRVSIFNIGVLSITRTYSLVRPFSQPPRVRVVMATIVVYSVLVLTQCTIPLWFGATFNYNWQFVECVESLPNTTALNSNLYNGVYWNAAEFIQFIVPMAVVLVSCGVTIATLWSNRAASTSGDMIRNQATTTILVLTGIYIFFNTPILLYWAVATVNSQLPDNSQSLTPFFDVFDGPTDADKGAATKARSSSSMAYKKGLKKLKKAKKAEKS
eukprot:sb/3466956/